MQDAGKAAALKVYVGVCAKALLWENDHPEEYAKAYLVGNQGLSAAAATEVSGALGTTGIPTTWDNANARLQATADLLATEQKHDKLDVNTLSTAASRTAAGSRVVSGDAA